MIDKVAVVTGANKGIGYGIVNQLCKRGVKVVYLTARDKTKGRESVKALEAEGYHPIFHQLDVTDGESVKKFADFVKSRHGGIDILINNAGIVSKDIMGVSYEDATVVINTNFNSILTIEKYIFPLLKDKARVINMSSECGHLSKIKNKYWIKKLAHEDVTLNDIQDFTKWFLDSVKNNTMKEEDFEWSILFSYVISKVAVSAYTRVQQKKIDRDISINSLHPGFVKTSMTKKVGYLTIEEASDAPVYLTLDADQSIKGKYIWFDKTEKDWTNIYLDLNYIDSAMYKEFVEKFI